MESKRKQKLIKLYEDNYKEWFYYYDIQDYVSKNKDIYAKFIKGYPQEEEINKWLKLIDYQHSIVYLGVIESLRTDDYEYLDNALYTYVNIGLVRGFILGSGYDHCVSAWNLMPIVLCSNRFDLINKIYPKECGLSKNGMAFLKAATNLIMQLYYNADEWKDDVIKQTEKYLSQKDSLENKSIVSALYALLNKDFNQFSIDISNVCKGRKKSRLFAENKFTKEFSFYSLALYNLARYLYPNDIEKITLPEDENFLMDYCLYQEENNYPIGSQLVIYEEPLTILNEILNVDTPFVSLVKEGRSFIHDTEVYKQELINRLITE